ncbi:MAG: LysR family transcriptional regulator [Anaeromyxobacteraceae bacterium]
MTPDPVTPAPAMDLNAAAIFVRVASTLSFSTAARALGVPRSTVSRKIAALEAMLGARLLERTSRAVRLTDAGRRFQEDAERALVLLERGRDELAELSPVRTGELRVLVGGVAAEWRLLGLVTRFATDHPRVRLVIDVRERPPERDADFDVVVRTVPRSTTRRDEVELCASQLVVVASPAYLLQAGTPRTPAELRTHAILGRSGDKGPVTWQFQDEGETLGIELEPRVAAGHVPLIAKLAESGAGIAQVQRFVVREALDAGRLVELLERFRPPRAALVASTPGRVVRPVVRAFVDALRRHHLDLGDAAGS